MMKEATLSNPLLGKVNALAVLAAWACLAFFVAALTYVKVAVEQDSSITSLILLFATFLVLVVTHITLSFFVRCPHCNGRLTAQGFAKPRYGDWSGAVVRWFSGSIVCIHCGNRVYTNG
ncbi:MAG TPA: hypothetical protein VNA21_02075 [Steroidobacteraceae bacterium]|nr:hypothetical protein [Steroidobacteraceae bacterium]